MTTSNCSKIVESSSINSATLFIYNLKKGWSTSGGCVGVPNNGVVLKG